MAARLTFGAVVSRRAERAREGLEEMCGLLSERLGERVELQVFPSPAALAHAVGQGETQLGWVSPTLLLMAPRLAKAVPLLSAVRNGRASFHSVVFGLRGEVDDVDDLVAARAAWVAPSSAAGYLVPNLTLTRMGVELSNAIAEERFYGTHSEVARVVADGDAEVGATYAHYEDGDARKALKSSGFHGILEPEEVSLLAVTGPIPADMIVAHSSLPPERREAVVEAMMQLSAQGDAGEALRRATNAEGFQLVSAAGLEQLRQLVNASLELRLTTSAVLGKPT